MLQNTCLFEYPSQITDKPPGSETGEAVQFLWILQHSKLFTVFMQSDLTAQFILIIEQRNYTNNAKYSYCNETGKRNGSAVKTEEK